MFGKLRVSRPFLRQCVSESIASIVPEVDEAHADLLLISVRLDLEDEDPKPAPLDQTPPGQPHVDIGRAAVAKGASIGPVHKLFTIAINNDTPVSGRPLQHLYCCPEFCPRH
eukprot:10906673-Heterocapsa_arctica.AAC.1